MNEDEFDTGPLEWSKPRADRAAILAGTICAVCLLVITVLFIAWGWAL